MRQRMIRVKRTDGLWGAFSCSREITIKIRRVQNEGWGHRCGNNLGDCSFWYETNFAVEVSVGFKSKCKKLFCKPVLEDQEDQPSVKNSLQSRKPDRHVAIPDLSKLDVMFSVHSWLRRHSASCTGQRSTDAVTWTSDPKETKLMKREFPLPGRSQEVFFVNIQINVEQHWILAIVSSLSRTLCVCFFFIFWMRHRVLLPHSHL